MDGFEFAVVGAGWRTDFFLRVAAALPQMNVCGVVARNRARAKDVESDWGVPCFASIPELLTHTQPSFVVASVSPKAVPDLCIEIAGHSVPVLAETPPAQDLEGLIRLYQLLSKLGARIQVAEQYWAQPLHAARQAVVDSGVLGPINQVNLSVCHGYHAMSLIRRLLGVGFESARIRGQRFTGRVIAGPDRAGPPREERVVEVDTDYASLDFGDRIGTYEFCLPQYRNWIRGQRVCIRGERGEIVDERVTYLKDEVTPINARLERHEAGRNGNLEGFHLKGIQFQDDWVYRNPVSPARLSDEEIAVAQCLLDMQGFVEQGRSFYSLEEASQDQYLALACAKAIETGETVQTEAQIWSSQS
ncbi:MAG: Gfo/Idh/MocA family oxidoreductase [Gammaproteobacteria bacterium]|nr:Gfo/Idh/MocA family oxidoreductase [Gammaproteobacteria bacterium]NNL45567.1 Gfo/Idh/MocA family oxidoreductase [Woeseiaceae bacterium]